jgi:UPF0176 protein
MALYNKIDGKVLKERIQQSDEKRTTISFYKYAKIGNLEVFRDHLFTELSKEEVLGRIYVANEGINAQISVLSNAIEEFQEKLNEITFLQGVRLNVAVEDDGKSFFKLKILVREKIVADGLHDDQFDASNCGQHLDANEFNNLVEDPNTILIDMRNHYESEVGHFKGAITPDVDTFRDSLPIIEEMLEGNEEKNLVMYCTGGIRCEKASAYYKYKGFKQVFQLNGGIINYVKQVNDEGLENKFIGKNFVFDERLGERVSPEIISNCHTCGKPCDDHLNCKNDACHLLFIQCSECKETFDNCCSTECVEFLEWPEDERKEFKRGLNNSQQIYKKGRKSNFVEQFLAFKAGNNKL